VCKLPGKVRTCIITSFEKKSSQKAYHLWTLICFKPNDHVHGHIHGIFLT
jgi:hypothetical protein